MRLLSSCPVSSIPIMCVSVCECAHECQRQGKTEQLPGSSCSVSSITIMCVSVCEYAHECHRQGTTEQFPGIWSSRQLWDLQHGCWEPYPGPFQEQQAILTTAPSPDPGGNFLWSSKESSCEVASTPMCLTNSLCFGDGILLCSPGWPVT